MTANPMLDAAIYYASRGWFIFQVKPREKTPMGKWKEEASNDVNVVRKWWTVMPTANIGLVCGSRSGIVVLDIDADKDGEESLLQLVADNGKLPHSIESITGGGGRHILFNHPGVAIRNSASKLGPGLDIRGDGGYIVVPPSIHPSGKGYEWEVSSKPSRNQLAEMPTWLLDMLVEHEANHEREDHAPEEIPERITEGGRNATLASLAGSMRRRGMSENSILAALHEENNAKCNPPLSNDEVIQIAKSVSRYPPTAPPIFKGNGSKPEAHDPLDAYSAALAFIELLDDLEGRSIPTFITGLDRSIGGLERQSLTVLAARPSMGKSTLAWQIARNVVSNGLKAYFFSLEMSVTSLWAKAACGATGIRWRDIRAGEASLDEIDKVIEKSVELMDLYGSRLLVDDGVNSSETIWHNVEKYRPDLVVIDHLRLVADKDEREVIRLGTITQHMKEMAKAFNCAVLCLAQLNRGVESRDNKRPTLSDLRDSGQIEENADMVLMMYREDYYDTPNGKQLPSTTELLIRKFRDDIKDQRVVLSFNTRHQWFADVHEIKV